MKRRTIQVEWITTNLTVDGKGEKENDSGLLLLGRSEDVVQIKTVSLGRVGRQLHLALRQQKKLWTAK
jgi:hypothetical protein